MMNIITNSNLALSELNRLDLRDKTYKEYEKLLVTKSSKATKKQMFDDLCFLKQINHLTNIDERTQENQQHFLQATEVLNKKIAPNSFILFKALPANLQKELYEGSFLIRNHHSTPIEVIPPTSAIDVNLALIIENLFKIYNEEADFSYYVCDQFNKFYMQ